MKKKEKIAAGTGPRTGASKSVDYGNTRELDYLLHSIVQGFSIPAFVIGKDHKIIYWNRALEKLSGIPASEVVGTNQHWRAFYASERPCMADLLMEGEFDRIPKWYAGKYSKSELLENSYEATDFFPDLGENGRWLRFTAAPILDSRDQVVGAVETLEDITDQKTAELERQDIEQTIFSVIEGSPIPAFVIGIDHKVLFWNRALERLSKIPAEEVVGTNQHWRAFYASERPCIADLLVFETPEVIHEWYRGVSKSKLLEETYEAEGFFPDLGPGGKWLRFTAAAIRNFRGGLVGAIETLEDITERKTMEKRCVESERKLSSIIQGFAIPAFVIDRSHKVVYWNRALEKISRIEAKDIIGTDHHWKAFYAKERPCMADLLVDSAMDKVPKWYSGKYQESDLMEEAYVATDFFPDLGDKGKWLKFTAAVIRDSEGVLFGAVETLEDITEQKTAEEKVKKTGGKIK